MSNPPKMPKFKALKSMLADDPFYRRGYLVGAVVLRKKSPPHVRVTPSKAKGDLP